MIWSAEGGGEQMGDRLRARIRGALRPAAALLLTISLSGCVTVNLSDVPSAEDRSDERGLCPAGMIGEFEAAVHGFDPSATVVEARPADFEPAVVAPVLHGSCFAHSAETTVTPEAHIAFLPESIVGEQIDYYLERNGFSTKDGNAWTSDKSDWMVIVSGLNADTYPPFDPADWPGYWAIVFSVRL